MSETYVDWYNGYGFECIKGRRHTDKGDVVKGIWDGNRYYAMFEVFGIPWLHQRLHEYQKSRIAPEGT